MTKSLSRPLIVAVAAVAAVAVPAPASAGAGAARTVRVSVSSTGAQGNLNADGAAMSADGRFVAFFASSSNLVLGDSNGVEDVFVRDRRAGTTRRISVTRAGAQADDASWAPAISGNGRHVAFLSRASNLVPGDTNGVADVFVRDLRSGVVRRLSVSRAGAQANGASSDVAISASGRFVAFVSAASNLVPGDTNGAPDVFLRNVGSGALRRVSVSGANTQSNGQNEGPAISAGGRYVAFWSTATNLVPGDTNGIVDVFVRDLRTRTTRRVSVSDTGAQAASTGSNFGSANPSISATGRYVAFSSDAPNLVAADTNAEPDVFVRDVRALTTRRVSVSSGNAQADGFSYQPAISATGRYVAFGSAGSNLVPGDTNGEQDIFVRDRRRATTSRVSVSSRGVQANNSCVEPAISADGRHAAFTSAATSLVPGDTNQGVDVFVRDR